MKKNKEGKSSGSDSNRSKRFVEISARFDSYFLSRRKKNQRLAHSGKHWQQLAATTTINITTTTHWLVPLGSASCGGNGQGQGGG